MKKNESSKASSKSKKAPVRDLTPLAERSAKVKAGARLRPKSKA
jgi:hypothetical protein